MEVDDMTKLSRLDEQVMLDILTQRFDVEKIYTWTGRILLAVNPYKDLGIYDLNNKFEKTSSLDSPHIYAIAESSIRDIYAQGLDQVSVLISGESGAGKTESAKHIMRYLSYRCSTNDSDTGIERKVLASNPILEAFGNAKTTQNDNSSRFGKYINILFDDHKNILGAEIQTFLLEKVRVISCGTGERNFHIWYQLLADRNIDWQNFCYLRASADSPNINDIADFEETCQAFKAFNIESEPVCDLLLGILYIGNLIFDEDGLLTDNESQEALKMTATLWQIDMEMLEKLLTYRKIKAGNEIIFAKMNQLECERRRDSLAKAIYATLFDWLVNKINKELTPITNKRKDTKVKKSIGILDIFGFENFIDNGFEQLCINYTNEILQQLFQNFIFEQEQQEYIAEGIEWRDIEFPDNEEIITTIEKVFKSLDDECSLTKPSHLKLVQHVGVMAKESPILAVSKMQEANGQFEVEHFAGPVIYGDGLIEKNIDLRHPEQNAFGEGSNHSILSTFNHEGHQKVQTASISKQFLKDIRKLRDILLATKPYFVRCIKPNPNAISDEFINTLVSKQLRYCGILEATKISRAGFPARFLHAEFRSRYGNLIGNIPQFLEYNNGVREGRTKCYMKQDVYEQLEFAIELRRQHSAKRIWFTYCKWQIHRKTKSITRIIRFIRDIRSLRYIRNIVAKSKACQRLLDCSPSELKQPWDHLVNQPVKEIILDERKQVMEQVLKDNETQRQEMDEIRKFSDQQKREMEEVIKLADKQRQEMDHVLQFANQQQEEIKTVKKFADEQRQKLTEIQKFANKQRQDIEKIKNERQLLENKNKALQTKAVSTQKENDNLRKQLNENEGNAKMKEIQLRKQLEEKNKLKEAKLRQQIEKNAKIEDVKLQEKLEKKLKKKDEENQKQQSQLKKKLQDKEQELRQELYTALKSAQDQQKSFEIENEILQKKVKQMQKQHDVEIVEDVEVSHFNEQHTEDELITIWPIIKVQSGNNTHNDSFNSIDMADIENGKLNDYQEALAIDKGWRWHNNGWTWQDAPSLGGTIEIEDKKIDKHERKRREKDIKKIEALNNQVNTLEGKVNKLAKPGNADKWKAAAAVMGSVNVLLMGVVLGKKTNKKEK
tara:strand:+ start:5127 stop:8480 length:3354 start_codon:yes stop_codon:yes gene_type:complete